MTRIEPLVGQRQRNETSRAVQACNDYLRAGRGRSLADLHRQYTEINTCQHSEPPTRIYATLRTWSSRYGWAERAEAYDAELEAQKNERARQIMESGLALDFERVEKLKWLGDFLEEQIREQGENGVFHNVWLPDVKQIGAGEYAERIDIERYNSPLITDLRGVYDDLAKETGGRNRQVKVAAEVVTANVELTDAERQAVIAGMLGLSEETA